MQVHIDETADGLFFDENAGSSLGGLGANAALHKQSVMLLADMDSDGVPC